MTAFVDLHDTVPVEPEKMQFTASPAKSCRGCLFERQFSPVCKRAAALAVKADLPDCDAGFIYVLVETDPRQLSITPEGEK